MCDGGRYLCVMVVGSVCDGDRYLCLTVVGICV